MLLISATWSQQDYSPMKGTAGNVRNNGVKERLQAKTEKYKSCLQPSEWLPYGGVDGLDSNKQRKDHYQELQGGHLWFSQCKDDLSMN